MRRRAEDEVGQAGARRVRARPDGWFELSGGALCLDFANTVSERPSAAPIERLETVADLLDWSQRAGILTTAAARSWAETARLHPRVASRRLVEARAAREDLYRLFAGLATGSGPPAGDALAPFTARLHRLLAKTTLRPRPRAGRGDGATLRWSFAGAGDSDEGADLDALLWPIWWSAAELLTAGPDARLRQCEARDCGWLFLDRSRGHRRRWCDMRVCGNREKLRRFRGSGTAADA